MTTQHPPAEILIVDDSASNLDLLSSILKQAGYAVRATTQPTMALHSVSAHPPDLALLDVRMPGIDGLSLCRELKQHPRTIDIPVIFVSALNDVSNRVAGLEAGGVDFIGKPFQREEVLARVRTHLALRAARQALDRQNQSLEMLVQQRSKELIQQRNVAHQYLDIAGVMLAALDFEGHILMINRRGGELLGQPVSGLLGSNLLRFFTDTSRHNLLHAFRRLVGQDQTYDEHHDVDIHNSDGQRLTLSSRSRAIRDDQGMPTGILCSAEDVTERQKARLQAVAQAEELRIALAQLQTLSAHTRDSIEQERLAVASDIHDQIGASLTGARLLLHQFESRSQELPQPAIDLLTQVGDLVGQALSSTRGVYTRLRPPMIDDLGLAETCRWYLSDWAKKSGMRVSQSRVIIPHEPEEALRLDVFRILQELLTNVARHSGATKVQVRLEQCEQGLDLSVTDNGRGFNPRQCEQGFGLQGIQGRLNRHRGSLACTHGSAGMTVAVHIPAAPVTRS